VKSSDLTREQQTAALLARAERQPGGCMYWRGRQQVYGTVAWDDRIRKVHRLIFEIIHGPIAPGLCVCHHCDTPGCINPEHLYAGTPSQNMRDMVLRRRNPALITSSQAHFHSGRAPRGEEASGAKLSEEGARAVLRDHRAGMSTKKLMEKYGLSRPSVQGLLRGTTWRHLRQDDCDADAASLADYIAKYKARYRGDPSEHSCATGMRMSRSRVQAAAVALGVCLRSTGGRQALAAAQQQEMK